MVQLKKEELESLPKHSNIWEAITFSIWVRTRKVNLASWFAKRMDYKNEIIELEVTTVGSLGILWGAVSKLWQGIGWVSKSKLCLGSVLNYEDGGLPKTADNTMRRGGLFIHSRTMPKWITMHSKTRLLVGASLPHLWHFELLDCTYSYWLEDVLLYTRTILWWLK